MTDEQKRREIAYKRQGLEQIKNMVSDEQYQERKEVVDKEIMELDGKSHGRR
ncbi:MULTISPECIES: hypothetical protein [Clostridium]|uniref:hypothetical protein n=1 Tax=Clostridium TaxID=1485 RepID=UPI000AB633FB|nr:MULTISPECIES: hypothetical protein [Clostridium]MCD2348109.1 hypothetical protein [Clostridium guangxiense]